MHFISVFWKWSLEFSKFFLKKLPTVSEYVSFLSKLLVLKLFVSLGEVTGIMAIGHHGHRGGVFYTFVCTLVLRKIWQNYATTPRYLYLEFLFLNKNLHSVLKILIFSCVLILITWILERLLSRILNVEMIL